MSNRFCDFESENDISLIEIAESSLTSWYKEVRCTPIDQLGTGDICRAVRQNLFIKDILPIALQLVMDDVLAGDLYDGELISALSSLNPAVYVDMKRSKDLLQFLTSLNSDIFDKEIQDDILKLVRTIEVAVGTLR